MSSLHHILFAIAYTVLAIAVGLTLPYSNEGFDRPTALLMGAFVFLFGAVLHEVTARQQRDRNLARWLARLRSGDEELASGLDRLQAELRALGAAHRQPAAVPEPALASAAAGNGAPSTLVGGEPVPARTPAPDDEIPEAAVAEALRAAVTGDRVRIYHQPVVVLPQRRHRLSMVFARLRLAGGYEVGPSLYRSQAAQDGVIAFIDNLLLFRTVQLVHDAEKRGLPLTTLCAVSVESLGEPDFMQPFLQVAADNPGLASRLFLALPQADLAEADGPARAAIRSLADRGFRFVMTDVRHLGFEAADLLAEHIRFVVLDAGRLLDPSGPLGGLDAALALKAELDRHAIDLIVDGIASEQQLVELLDLRLDYGQGPLFGDPRPLN